MDKKIGFLIKQLRKQNKITLQVLAEISGLSTSYLSLLERGLTSPTIENLNTLCQCLDITLTDLLSNLDSKKTVIKKNERKLIFDNLEGIYYEALTEVNEHMRGMTMTVDNSKLNNSSPHIADEVGYILQGSLEFTLGNSLYILEPGDTIYVPANTSHSFRKISKETCVSIWIFHNPKLENHHIF